MAYPALDEEIKRKLIEDALSTGDYPADDSESDKPPKKVEDVYGDWEKWPSLDPSNIIPPDVSTPPPGHIDLTPPAPPGHIDLKPPLPRPPEGIQTDPETGQRYIIDPTVSAGIVPYAELATEADKEALGPSDLTLPKETIEATPPAPDTLTQVERGELVGLPWPRGRKAVQPAPDTLAQVEKALPAHEAAPGTLTQVEKALPTGLKAPGTHTELAPPGQMDLRPDVFAPAAQPAAPAAQPAAQPAPAAPAAPAFNPNDWRTWTTPDGTPAGGVTEKPSAQEVASYTQPNGTPYPTRIQAVGNKDPSAFIVHHTSGRGTVDGVVSTLRERGLGVEYVMDRNNIIYKIGDSGAQQIKTGWGPKGTGLNNSNTVGMEIIANNDGDVTEGQKQAFARFMASRYPTTPILGHGEVNPGHKEVDEGISAKNAALAFRGGEVTVKNDIKEQIDSLHVLNQLSLSGLNVTHFGYQGDKTSDSDSAAGRGKYVQRMIPGYDVALNAAAAQLVGNPRPGEEFEYAGRTWRYGDMVPERYKDARFDIYDSHNTVLSGEGKLGKGIAAPKQEYESWVTLSPEEQATAESQQKSQEYDTLNSINERTPNRGELWKILNSPSIPGVSQAAQEDYRARVKQQITDYAVEYYKESEPNITPEQAFQKATGDADFGTLAGEVATKIMPNYNSMAIALNRAPNTIDENRINDFLSVINPNLPPEKRIEFKRQTMAELKAMSPRERSQYIGMLIAGDPQRLAGFSADTLADSFDRISDPEYQAKLKSDMDLAVAKNKHDLATDPRLVNTAAEGVTQFLASLPKNLSETFSGPIGQSAMLSEIYFHSADQLRKEHPDWSEEDIRTRAGASTLAQLGPQEILMKITGGAMSAATRGITKPLMELGARYGLHGSTAAVMGGMQRMIANHMEGRPLMDGVMEAAAGTAPYGVIGAFVGGRHPAEIKERGIPADTGVIPEAPIDTGVTHGPEEPINTGFSHGPSEPIDTRFVHGPPIPRTAFTPSELAERVSSMKGRTPEELAAEAQDIQPMTDLTARSVYLNGDMPPSVQVQESRAQAWVGQQALGQRIASLSTAHRSVLSDLVRQGMPVEEAYAGVSRSTATSYNDIRRDAQAAVQQPHIRAVDQTGNENIAAITQSKDGAYHVVMQHPDAGPGEVILTTGAQGNLIKRQGYSTREEAQAAARDIFKRNGDTITHDPAAVPGSGGVTGGAGIPEPWVSEIANRYVKERLAAGEIGAVEPGTGKTTEQLLAMGMRMGPEEVNQHNSDIMHGVGDPVRQTAAVRAEEARLSHRSHQASLVAEADPADREKQIEADNALKDLTDLYNGPMKRLKENWHRQGVAFQDRIPIDLSTYNGIRAQFIKSTGKKEVPVQAKEGMQKSAKRVRTANEALKTKMKKLGEEIDRQSARRSLPTHEQNREAIAKRMRGEFPCPT